MADEAGHAMWSAEKYIDDVVAGRVVACHWVQQAAQRHIDDLREGGQRGLVFDRDAAEHALKFFTILKHSKGEWAGRPIELEPWQQFLLWVLFGWKKDDGTRRFRTAYIEVARKNGKSTIGAGVGLYLLAADGEPGAEIYSAATKRDQARITHLEAVRMVRASPMLRKRIRTFRDNLNIGGTASKFEPLGADADTLDGLNIHGAIIDEIHAHKTREVWDKIDTATGARRQPLMFGITTAGYDRQSLCWTLNEYTKKILDRVIDDDSDQLCLGQAGVLRQTLLLGNLVQGVDAQLLQVLDVQIAALDLLGERFEAVLDRECRAQSTLSVVLVSEGGTEKGHDPVAGKLVDRPLILVDLIQENLETTVQDLMNLFRF